MNILKFICTCLAMLALTSCENRHSDPATVHYRFIQQITAYHEDGGVSYKDFVAHTGTTEDLDGKVSFDLAPSAGKGSVELKLEFEGDAVVILIDDVETRGNQNSWVRIRRRDSDTFGSATECEIWVGSRTPSNE